MEEYKCQSDSSSLIEIEIVTLEYKFVLVSDNLDVQVHRSHATSDRFNLDYHIFHTIAVKNQIPTPKDLIGIQKQPVDVMKLNLGRFLPNEQNENLLRDKISMLISPDLVKYMEHLLRVKPFVINHQH